MRGGVESRPVAFRYSGRNLAGGVVGARTAVSRGSGFVRAVFLVVGAALIARLTWGLVAG